MTKKIEVGVFLPSVRHGWVHSSNVPYSPGSYKHVLEVVRLAEFLGFDFVLSPQNWRGGQGPSRYWGDTVESIALTGALLQATQRIQVATTCHVNVYHPAAVAKIISSFSEIGDGRIWMNIVTGGHKTSFSHLGLWDDSLGHDERYDMADEWIELIKKYWTQESVTHEGKFYQADDGILSPRPKVMPTLVNAGASPRGLRFAVDNCDVCFLMGGKEASYTESAKLARSLAKERGKEHVKIFGLMTLIPGNTDAQAQDYVDWIERGVDLEGLADLSKGYIENKDMKKMSSSSKAPMGGTGYRSLLPGPYVGSYDTLAREISETVKRNDLDGILLIVPDYITDLNQIAMQTFSKLPEYGIECSPGINIGR